MLCIGTSLVFGPILGKSWRLYKVFTQRVPDKRVVSRQQIHSARLQTAASLLMKNWRSLCQITGLALLRQKFLPLISNLGVMWPHESPLLEGCVSVLLEDRSLNIASASYIPQVRVHERTHRCHQHEKARCPERLLLSTAVN